MKIVIIGAGEVGYHIAGRLSAENKDVVVIDKDPQALLRVSENIDVQTILGSGSSPNTLREAGISDAEILLAVTDSDEINLVACLVSGILSASTKKLARIRGADFDAYHETFRENAPHIDMVINPEIEVVKTIDRLMAVPGAADVSEFAEGRIKFVGIYVENDSPLENTQLMGLSEKTDGKRILIAAIVRDEKLIIPRGKDRLMPGDLVYVISEAEDLQNTLTIFGKRTHPVKRALIVGGGRIGFRLAERLEQKGIHCKIIEKNAQRCEYLSEKLAKAIVLHGDGSDQSLLSEENAGDIDVAVTLTNDDETNILVSLLTQRLGVHKNITKISKFSYHSLMKTIGIEQVVSTRLSAINSILQHIRRGKVLNAISIKGELAEVVEAVALETSDIVSKPISKISFPKGSLVIGIIRNSEIIIPSGESTIEPDDRVIIFAVRTAIAGVEKLLSVKLEFI
ncbi:MAG: Trk system potassium transporter TrkA [Desulfobacteraceae bacterium]|nr:Trk system potassium transporter TrkA [Desulfobacteraceae bacterium]